PGSLDVDKLAAYKEAGVNRMSIGIQSVFDPLLAFLGRSHKAESWKSTLEMIRKAGFSNINTDLIFGIPGQTAQMWEETLNLISGQGIPHISCYSLEPEKGTRLEEMYRTGIVEMPPEDLEREMYYTAKNILRHSGYRHYEISNFAFPGFECSHNIRYWKTREYIGLGAGAHSYYDGYRYDNKNDIILYSKCFEKCTEPLSRHDKQSSSGWRTGDPRCRGEATKISQAESLAEFIIFGLRMIDGVNLVEAAARFGGKGNILGIYGDKVKELIRRGLLETSGERLKLTDKGLDLANSVMLEFI
ncbi:MAG: coproporphyrinogen-III oxidase family protein, partial [Eubacteriales bacterium]|nr:coproporphyrinogen-III oxidase family protein [Eubacteriales bacterium]